MILWDKKRAIETILRRRNKEGQNLGEAPMKTEVVKHDDGQVDGRHVAAQDAIMAIQEKSPDKFMQALGNFVDLHKG